MKANTYDLHVRIQLSTAEKLKTWAAEQGIQLGEVIDFLAREYEQACERDDFASNYVTRDELDRELDRLMERFRKGFPGSDGTR